MPGRIRIAIAVLLAVAAPTAVPAETTANDAPAIVWMADPDEALAAAREGSRPVLVDVYADWCEPCHVMDRQTWAEPAVVRAADGFVALKLDSERYVAFTNRYGASILPTTLVLESTGRLVTKLPGVVGPEDMLDLLNRVRAGWEGYRADAVRFDDPDALVRVADYLGGIGNVDGGASALQLAAGMLRSRDTDRARLQSVEVKLAQARVAQGRLVEAETELARLAGDGASPAIRAVALAGLADVYRRRGRTAQAERTIERLRAEYPDEARELGF